MKKGQAKAAGDMGPRTCKVDLALIPQLVDEGLSPLEIANTMGWTVGTLRVKCSHLKISLRRRGGKFALPGPLLDQLHRRAVQMGVSTTELVANLLEEIVRDDLFDAVLDKREFTMAHPALSAEH
jgi:hypothetical protein